MSSETLKITLRNFGITESETEIYVFLAKGGTLKTGQIAKQLRKNKGTVYRTLSNLKKKGFVESTLESPTRYVAIPLQKIIDSYIKSKREEVTQVEKTKTELLKDWERIRKARIQPIMEKFAVVEGNKKIYSKILQMIEKTENQISIILPISKISRGEQFGIFEEFTKHPKKSKIKFRMLTELSKQNLKATKLLIPKIKSEIDFRATIPNSKQRTLPRMVIRDRKEVLFFISPKTDLFSTGQNDSCLFINSKSLVETLIDTFEDLWKDSIFAEDRIFEIETGKILPQPLADTDAEIVTNYDTILSTVKEKVRSLPLLAAQITRIERSLPIFVGRQDELRQLDQALEKVREGKGSTIIISGEAVH